jgi:transposase
MGGGRTSRSIQTAKASGPLTVSAEQLQQLQHRIHERKLEEADYRLIEAILETVVALRNAVQQKSIAVKRLLRIVFGPRSEKTRTVLPKAHPEPPDAETVSQKLEQNQNGKRPGHGRAAAAQYWGARRVVIPHANLACGDPCPQCPKGRLYDTRRPGLLVHFQGSPPVMATVYECQSLRCSACGALFSAEAPEGARRQKYDASAGSTVAVLKYGHGFPFYRLEQLQKSLGIPLPASTQWQLVEQKASLVRPVYEALLEQAARGDLLHNDDTAMKILQYLGKRAGQAEGPDGQEDERSGVYTTGMISLVEGHQIALFATGRQHAGENLAQLLEKRPTGLAPPIQMCDALSRNLPAKFQVILCNCLAHARRRFVELAEDFPAECEEVLEALKAVYHHDEQAKHAGLTSRQRLEYHQTHSRPVMEELKRWLHAQFDERKVEPNSAMGEAIRYLLGHWEPLTRFLRVPGAPLDNNIVERALKRAILHRKNALFYKTQHGAFVGDVLMSLIYTCLLCGTNPLDYLTELERHATELSEHPGQWLPWNYKGQMASTQPVPA